MYLTSAACVVLDINIDGTIDGSVETSISASSYRGHCDCYQSVSGDVDIPKGESLVSMLTKPGT